MFDPEPFSDAEDRAVASGLQGVPLGDEGINVYFGVYASNSTDTEMRIPFISLERERFLEYDLTKMIYSLAHPEKNVVGLITRIADCRRPDAAGPATPTMAGDHPDQGSVRGPAAPPQSR